jgi:hypothetical protein
MRRGSGSTVANGKKAKSPGNVLSEGTSAGIALGTSMPPGDTAIRKLATTDLVKSDVLRAVRW